MFIQASLVVEINGNYVKINDATREGSLKRKEKRIWIRKELYEQLEREVSRRLGRTSSGLLGYRQDFDRPFYKRWTPVLVKEFFQELEEARVILMGDFHALHQSQKSHVRLLRKMIEQGPLVLAIEFIDHKYQAPLDDYLANKLTDQEFLVQVDWQQNWGFPWRHYRPILQWAKENKVPVYAINQTYRSRTAETLDLRDWYSAEKISDILYAHPDEKVAVIFGDLHLGESHLVEKICQLHPDLDRAHIYRIYQNSEILYFKMMELGIDHDTDILKSEQQQYCLMSVPPWVKWQNYLLFLENTLESSVEFYSDESLTDAGARSAPDVFLDDEDEILDYTDHILKFVEFLKKDLEISVSISDLSVYSLRDEMLFEKIETLLDGARLDVIQRLINDQRSFYLPELPGGVLVRPTVNHAAQLAMSYILSQVLGLREFLMPAAENIERLIWRECLIYVGSKIINPRQKTDTLVDLQNNLQLKKSAESMKEALQVALTQKMNELMRGAGFTEDLKVFKAHDVYSFNVAANLLGRMMGEKIHFAYEQGKISETNLRKMIGLERSSTDFKSDYYKLVRKIDSLPEPFKSKRDKL